MEASIANPVAPVNWVAPLDVKWLSFLVRVLIVPDKFKGTLRAEEAARCIAEGWRNGRPGDVVEMLPMSDGGDGFGEVMAGLLGAERRETMAVNAAHQPVEVAWWWSEKTRTAVFESARANGLAMLPRGRFHPFELDTFGIGEVIRQIAEMGTGLTLIVGIGGSATNDGGFGMARALGYRFLDQELKTIEQWISLQQLRRIEMPAGLQPLERLVIATDVQNRLLGAQGASRVYGPQKGLRPEDMPLAEGCLERLSQVVRLDLKIDAAEEPGTGAAGGLGYGLRVFLGGEFKPGFELFAETAGLAEKIRQTDLVITAEGSIDRSTMMGKGTGAVAQMARDLGKQCIGLAGILPDGQGREGLFRSVHSICPSLASVEDAMASPKVWLTKLANKAATEYA